MITDDSKLPCAEVFDRVQAGRARYGLVPFENSTHGTVTFTLDALADRAGAYADIVVRDEVYLDVHHFLLGRFPPTSASDSSLQPAVSASSSSSSPPNAPPTLSPSPLPPTSAPTSNEQNGVPLVSLSHLRRVYSHPQALGQTASFLARYLPPGTEQVDVSSTSRAAELAAADATGTSAAVASEAAGKAAGLDVLARWVEDRGDNATRFFVLARRVGDMEATDEEGEGESGLRSRVHGGGAGEGRGEEKGDVGGGDAYGGGKYKSLVSFTVPHRRAGALADVLDCFRGRGLNLTSISSVPSLDAPFQYLFFLEFEGSRFHDPEGRVTGVFEDLQRVSERWRWLGSWRNRRVVVR
jgi:prephenate dehydratase